MTKFQDELLAECKSLIQANDIESEQIFCRQFSFPLNIYKMLFMF